LLRLCSGRLRSCRCCRRRLGSGGLGRCSGLLCVLYGSLRCGFACRSGHRACVRCHSASGCSPGSRLFRLSDDFRCLSFHHSLFLLGHARRSLSKVYFEPPDTSARRPISKKPPPGSGPQAVKHTAKGPLTAQCSLFLASRTRLHPHPCCRWCRELPNRRANLEARQTTERPMWMFSPAFVRTRFWCIHQSSKP
jgi:hypothetical protein